jgi:hypothetical protein
MEILITAIVAFVFGYWLNNIVIIRRVLRDPETMIKLLEKYKQAKDQEESTIIPIEETLLSIDRVEGMYYAYEKDGKFLAQGTDFRTMFQTIKDRFPQRSFRIDKYQANLTEEEAGRLVKSVFEVFAEDSSEKSKQESPNKLT